jgi:asparagine N-glycosylation enzyme membrane subunit Stt3
MSVLFSLNWDRILYVFTVAVALFAGAFLGSFLQ